MEGKTFVIGEPFGRQTGKDEELDIVKAIYTFADYDNDNCLSKDEMTASFEWGTQDKKHYEDLVNAYF